MQEAINEKFGGWSESSIERGPMPQAGYQRRQPLERDQQRSQLEQSDFPDMYDMWEQALDYQKASSNIRRQPQQQMQQIRQGMPPPPTDYNMNLVGSLPRPGPHGMPADYAGHDDKGYPIELLAQMENLYQRVQKEKDLHQQRNTMNHTGRNHRQQMNGGRPQQQIMIDHDQVMMNMQGNNCYVQGVPYVMVPLAESNISPPYPGDVHRQGLPQEHQMSFGDNWETVRYFTPNDRQGRKGKQHNKPLRQNQQGQRRNAEAEAGSAGTGAMRPWQAQEMTEAVAGTGETPSTRNMMRKRGGHKAIRQQQPGGGMHVGMSPNDVREHGTMVMLQSAHANMQLDIPVMMPQESNVPLGLHTMKEQLEALRLEDPSTVFIARRINKLGFQSAELLQLHFSAYGKVKGVFVSHSRVKAFQSTGRRNRGGSEHQRLRAAGLGFVVMETAEDAAAILAEGAEHVVNGITVQLKPFQRFSGTEEGNDFIDDADHQNVLLQGGSNEFGARERWHSPGSDF